MHAVDEVIVLGTMLEPEGVEVCLLAEGAEEWKDVDDLGGVGREVGLVGGGGELGRWLEVEGQGDVLGEVEAGVSEGVLAGCRCRWRRERRVQGAEAAKVSFISWRMARRTGAEALEVRRRSRRR